MKLFYGTPSLFFDLYDVHPEYLGYTCVYPGSANFSDMVSEPKLDPFVGQPMLFVSPVLLGHPFVCPPVFVTLQLCSSGCEGAGAC